jgi:hypothetical protein
VRWETGTDGGRYLRQYQEPCPEGMTRTEWGNCTSTANVPLAPVGGRDDEVRSYDSSTPANQLPVIGGTSPPLVGAPSEYRTMTNKDCNRDSDCSTTVSGASIKCFVDPRSLSPTQIADLRQAAPWSGQGDPPYAAINSFLATLTGIKGVCHINRPATIVKEGETCPTGYRVNPFGGGLFCNLIMD